MSLRSLLAVSLGVFLISACGEDDPILPAPDPTARVKVVHAVADAPSISVRFDDDAPVIATLGFGEVTPATPGTYLQAPTGTPRLRVNAGDDQVVDVTAPTLAVDGRYTLIVTGRASGTPDIGSLFLTDDNTPPGAGNSRLRVVHAAATVGNVDIYVGTALGDIPANPTLTNVAFRGSAYLPVAPVDNYRVCIVPAGGDPVLGCAINVTTGALVQGSIATVIALDAASGSSALSAAVTVDRAP